MSHNLDSVKQAMLASGGKSETRRFRYGGHFHEVLTFVRHSVPSGEACHFRDKHAPLLVDENAVIFLRSFPKEALTIDELIEMSQEEINNSSTSCSDIWLVTERNLELQLALLDELKYSDGSTELDAQLAQCKTLLRRIGDSIPFVLCEIFEGLVVIAFTRKPSRETVENFLPDVIEFLTKCERLEFSPSTYLREILRGGAIVL
jgi:hypothetical protein